MERCDFRYLPRDRDRDELLPLLLLLSLLEDPDLLFAFIGVFTEGDAFFPTSAGFLALLRVLALLDALLLRDELPDELDRLEPEELDPELEELLLPEDELGGISQLMRTKLKREQ